MSNNSMKDILLGDLAKAKSPGKGIPEALDAGKHIGKIISFTEEPGYNLITMEVNKVKHNFFYDFLIRNTDDLNAEVIAWFKALATIQVDENTTMLEIANSAVGSSYTFEVYNYVSKKGKNKGRKQHAIRFSTLPTIETVIVEEEEVELPI